MPMAEPLLIASRARVGTMHNANRVCEAALCRLGALPNLAALQPFQTWPQA